MLYLLKTVFIDPTFPKKRYIIGTGTKKKSKRLKIINFEKDRFKVYVINRNLIIVIVSRCTHYNNITKHYQIIILKQQHCCDTSAAQFYNVTSTIRQQIN